MFSKLKCYPYLIMKNYSKSKEELLQELHELRLENASLKVSYDKECRENNQVVEKLKASEEKFRSFFENHVAVKLLIDPENGNIFDANEAAAQFYGWKIEELKMMHLSQINISPGEEVNNNIHLVLTKEKSNFEVTHCKADGSLRDVSINSGMVLINEKEYLYSIINDITDRKQSEEALRKSELRFRTIFEDAPLGIALIDSVTGKIYEVNPMFAKITGRTVDEMIKTDWISITHPDDIQEDIDNVALLVKGEINGFQMEKRYIRPDGTIVWVHLTISHLIKEDHMPLRHLCMIEDISELKKSAEKLLVNERRFKDLFNLSPIAIALLDMQGHPIVSNAALSQMVGYSNTELSGMTFAEFTYPEDVERDVNQFNALYEGKISEYNMEKRYVHKNGNIVWGNLWVTIRRDSNGNPEEIIGMAEDITKRTLAEEELKQSELKFRKFIEHAPLAIIASLNGRLSLINENAMRLFGFENAEDLKGKLIYEFFAPDYQEMSKERTKLRSLGHHVPTEFESVIQRSDGKKVPVQIAVSQIQLNEGKVNISFISDLTERKKSEDALKESEDLYRNLVERLRDGVYRSTHEGKYVEVNSAMVNMLGYESKEDLMNIDIKSQLYLDPIDREKLIMNEDLDGFDIFPLKKKDGTVIWCEDNGWYIRDDNGNIIVHEGIMRDITKRREAELLQQESNKLIEIQNQKLITTNIELISAKEKAEESDRLKSAFLANMSHEIRTPMNGILGFAELLKDSKLSSDEQHEYISIIEQSGARMLNIINDIVDISKIESGQMTVNISESNINEQIEYVYTFFKPEVEQKGMKLFYENALTSKESIIKTDREKVYAILINLVKNAIKYSDKGSIKFGYEQKGEYLEFFVKDTGIGIAKDRQRAIFERFVQADIGDKRAYQGAGLGLTISKSHVEMLGGKIWVKSEEGKGTEFYFTLPFNTNPAEELVVKKEGGSHDLYNLNKKLKILIAEDDEPSKRLIAVVVKSLSNSVLKVRTGVEAVEACRDNPDIDLVLMDIQMPEMNGYEATRQIRQFNKDVIIIAQTAYALTGDREKAMEAGCNDYIAKPLNINVLKELVKNHLKK